MFRCLITFVLALVPLLAAAQAPRLPSQLGIRPNELPVELGRKLFFDPILSQDGTISCSTCHDPKHGWADSNRLAVGIAGRVGTRNSPSIINKAYHPALFHDLRTRGLPTQSLQPILNVLEMGNQTENQVLNKLRAVPAYEALFKAAFGGTQIRNGRVTAVTRERYGAAMEAFQQTIVSFDAPVDRRMRGDIGALSPEAEIGYGLFMKHNCMACHQYPLFTDRFFHNNGMEMAKNNPNDQGRFAISGTNRQRDLRAFATASLREVHRSPPYGHAGQFDTLRQVVQFYNLGGYKRAGNQFVRDRFIDQRIQPLGLNAYQVDCLTKFLAEGFAGSSYPDIPAPMLPR